jgi:hypothetical protein
MLNYNLNIIEPSKQEKKNEDVRPPIYWSFESYASASDSSDLGELGFATMSITAPLTNCIQVSNDANGYFTTDAQYPVTASLTGSNWPITGSTTMSLYTAGITYDPIAVNQYYYAAISASALDIYNNPNLTGSVLQNNYSASEFFRFYTEATITHRKGNIYNPIVNWKTQNQSPSTDTGNVNGFTASFNIVKNRNESLVSVPQVTGSKVGAFNNLYALNITSSLSASVLNDATGSTTMSISIPQAGILTSSLILNQTTPGLQTISASFTASNNSDYNITASVIMNKGNIWNATLNVLSTGSNADSYSMYTVPTQFNIFKDVNVDPTVIDQNVNLLANALNTSKVDTLQTQYAFNFQNDVTESGTYPVYQVYTFPTTSLSITPAGTSTTLYNSGSIISYTESPYTSSYNITASAWINKIPSFDATIIVLGGGGGAGGGTTNGGAGYGVAGGGGGAGGFLQKDFQIVPNTPYTINSIGTGGTGSISGRIGGQDGTETNITVWLGPYKANGTASMIAGGGQGSQITYEIGDKYFNQRGGQSGASGLYVGGINTWYKNYLVGGAGDTNTAAGGGGGITGSGFSGQVASGSWGGFNLGGAGGNWQQTGWNGIGSIAPTVYFHTASFTWTGSAGNGSATGNGSNATALGGGGGGAHAKNNSIGGNGMGGAVIIAYSGSAKMDVPVGTITTFSDGVTWHLIKNTGSFSYTYAPKPNAEEQKYIWRTDTLVIAGGGQGGSDEGGGGGAGGYSYNPYTAYELGKTYSVIVGAGAPGTTNGAGPGSGSNSYIIDSTTNTALITAIGGGDGTGAGHNGGSGGGASSRGQSGGIIFQGPINVNYYVSSSQTQGNNGGAHAGGLYDFAQSGGGGGASTTGSNGDGSINQWGIGGLGKYDLSFSPIGVCGGGNSHGADNTTANITVWGGGKGASSEPGTGSAAPANRGGGGGGARGVGVLSGAGGSGKVQIKYAGTPRATGGQIETALVSGTYYTLHTYTASGTFTPIA